MKSFPAPNIKRQTKRVPLTVMGNFTCQVRAVQDVFLKNTQIKKEEKKKTSVLENESWRRMVKTLGSSNDNKRRSRAAMFSVNMADKKTG